MDDRVRWQWRPLAESWPGLGRGFSHAGIGWHEDGVAPQPGGPTAQATEILYNFGMTLREDEVARDGNGNAMGGIRMPDLEIGRGKYIAFDPPSFFGLGLYGTWQDLQCDPLPDGSMRFRNHGAYVSQFAHQAEKLVAQGYLLPEEADRLISDAAKSGIGKPNSCPP